MNKPTDVVVALEAIFNLPADRKLPIRIGDRFSLVVNNGNYPCAIESIEGGVIEPGNKGTITLRAIFHRIGLIPGRGDEIELRRGGTVIAKGLLVSPPIVVPPSS